MLSGAFHHYAAAEGCRVINYAEEAELFSRAMHSTGFCVSYSTTQGGKERCFLYPCLSVVGPYAQRWKNKKVAFGVFISLLIKN